MQSPTRRLNGSVVTGAPGEVVGDGLGGGAGTLVQPASDAHTAAPASGAAQRASAVVPPTIASRPPLAALQGEGFEPSEAKRERPFTTRRRRRVPASIALSVAPHRGSG